MNYINTLLHNAKHFGNDWQNIGDTSLNYILRCAEWHLYKLFQHNYCFLCRNILLKDVEICKFFELWNPEK